ncbi:MAG TPA: hypothetical protein VKB14_16530 [Actinomycetales bacterium]|nr:hypothetical protein [Actinomycetales bacterium]
MPAQAVAGERTTRPTMYVMVGLPASGKTTRAREHEAERVTARFATEPGTTFELGPQDPHAYRALFQAPTQDEVWSPAGGPPPSGHPTWTSRAAERWPTSTS